jgi:hypothetical protein
LKSQYPLSVKILTRTENLRVQLFNKHFYRLEHGNAYRQLILYEKGEQTFTDIGDPVALETIYKQIKVVYFKKKVLGIRKMPSECLKVTKLSPWKIYKTKKGRHYALLKKYYDQEAIEYSKWVKKMRNTKK